ncbi:MAG: hypothetical protein ACP5P4_12615 [Steroidobacteraceae bacterium]
MPFPEPIESQYVRSVLRNNRIVVRGACTLALMLVVLRAMQTLLGHRVPLPAVPAGVVLISSVGLLWLAWSPNYERRYLPLVLVSLRNVVGTVLLVRATAAGTADALMLAPLALIGSFCFLGLTLRPALLAGSFALLSELVAAWWYSLPGDMALSIALLMMITFIVCAFGGTGARAPVPPCLPREPAARGACRARRAHVDEEPAYLR